MTRFFTLQKCGPGCPHYTIAISGQIRCRAADLDMTAEDQQLQFPAWCPLEHSERVIETTDNLAMLAEARHSKPATSIREAVNTGRKIRLARLAIRRMLGSKGGI